MQWAQQWSAGHPQVTKGSWRGGSPRSAHLLLTSWILKSGENGEVEAKGVWLQLAEATTQESISSDVV